MKFNRLAILLALASPLMAQNVRWDLPIYTVQAQGGNLLPVYAIPGAGVQFFSCSGSVCTTLATTYISATSATTCPNSPTPMQVTLNGSSTCVSSADPYGNMGGWFQAGQYMATVTASGESYNYFFTISSSFCSSGCTLTGPLNGTSAAFSGDASAYAFLPAGATNTQGLWTRYGTVITNPSAAGDYSAQEPMVLSDGAGGIDMWLTCGFSSGFVCYTHCAPSADECTLASDWTALQVVMTGYEHGYVLKIGSTYYYYGANFSTGSLAFSRLHSTDKITWTLDANNILPINGTGWESTYVGNIDVWTATSTNGGPCPGNTWCALHEALGTPTTWAIGLATSPDGLTWTEYSGLANPTGTPTGTPSGSGGTVTAGSNYAVIVAVDAAGKTTAAGTESALVTTTGATASIAWAWTAVPNATSYQIFVGSTPGGEGNFFTSSTNSFTQTQAIGYGQLATLPAAATTGNPVIQQAADIANEVAGGPEMHYISATSTYMLWYHYGNIPTDITTGSSTNLIKWEVAGPAYSVGGGLKRQTMDEGLYTSQGQVADPSVLNYNGGAYMFYDATDTQNPTSTDAPHIKLVTSPLTIEQIAGSQVNGTAADGFHEDITGFGKYVLQNSASLNSPTISNALLLLPACFDYADQSVCVTTENKALVLLGSGLTVNDTVDVSGPDILLKKRATGDTIYAQQGSTGGNTQLFSIRTDSNAATFLNTQNSTNLELGVSSGSTAGSIVGTVTLFPSGNTTIGGNSDCGATLCVNGSTLIASARRGTFVCTGAGTITVANANAVATSMITISMNTAGGTITTPPAMKTPGNGTNFTVLCGATDTSTYNYFIWN